MRATSVSAIYPAARPAIAIVFAPTTHSAKLFNKRENTSGFFCMFFGTNFPPAAPASFTVPIVLRAFSSGFTRSVLSVVRVSCPYTASSRIRLVEFGFGNVRRDTSTAGLVLISTSIFARSSRAKITSLTDFRTGVLVLVTSFKSVMRISRSTRPRSSTAPSCFLSSDTAFF